jgi:hypothetical protein
MLSINATKNNLILFGAMILFLVVDLGQFFLAGLPAIPFLLSFYCMIGIYNPHYLFLLLAFFLQGLEYFCFYNLFSLVCLPLIPITGLALFFRKNLYPSYAHSIALSIVGIIIQIYAIEGYFLHIVPMPHYTIMRIGGTLFIAICFSLTINIWGVQDNRV